MVGNCDGSDIATLSFEAAQRGVLAFVAMSARTAQGALEELHSFNLPPQILASSLRGIIGQRVIKKLCPHSGHKRALTREEGDLLESQANFGRVLKALKNEQIVASHVSWKEVEFYTPQACAQCKEGYLGNVGLQEIVGEQWGEGLSLVEDGLFKAIQGLTSIEEILAFI
jgi:type II secretory ATPase GspE/PulE/Tfp pilus assembly ATPase PilB-like protein